MSEKRIEEWYDKFLGVLEHFKRNSFIHATLSVGANSEENYSVSLTVFVWYKRKREIKTSYHVWVNTWCDEMDEQSKKEWAAIERLMKK